jgi:glycolate oxidase FAD binding subunit
MQEYNPGEFTFTAQAGTPVKEVQRILAEHGQYLPFDPVLVDQGATLGGTVASGLSGPGRYRFGGVRDFILGVSFIDGQGNLVHSGGKVVKNAAGFDLPKLMVGSLGRFGVLVELSFKVFPRPAVCATLGFGYPSLGAASAAQNLLAGRPLELLALDVDPTPSGAIVWVRLGGAAENLTARLQRLSSLLGQEAIDTLEGDAESEFWRARTDFTWIPAGWRLVKIPITPHAVPLLDERLAEAGAVRQFSAGLNQAWVAWPGLRDDLHNLLTALGLSGLLVLGPKGDPHVGVVTGESFARRVRAALDPLGKFSPG